MMILEPISLTIGFVAATAMWKIYSPYGANRKETAFVVGMATLGTLVSWVTYYLFNM